MDNIKEIEKRRSEELLSKYHSYQEQIKDLKKRLRVKKNSKPFKIFAWTAYSCICVSLIYWGLSIGSSWAIAFFTLLSFHLWWLVSGIILTYIHPVDSVEDIKYWIDIKEKVAAEIWNDYQLIQKGSIDGSRVTEPLDK